MQEAVYASIVALLLASSQAAYFAKGIITINPCLMSHKGRRHTILTLIHHTRPASEDGDRLERSGDLSWLRLDTLL